MTQDVYRAFQAKNIFRYYGNDGDGSFNRYSTDNEGFEYPKGSGKFTVFEDGLVWGGYHKGAPPTKVGGSTPAGWNSWDRGYTREE